MTTWTLLIFIYAGAWARGDSVALAPVNDFTTQPACEAAGKAATSLTTGTSKETRFVCLPRK